MVFDLNSHRDRHEAFARRLQGQDYGLVREFQSQLARCLCRWMSYFANGRGSPDVALTLTPGQPSVSNVRGLPRQRRAPIVRRGSAALMFDRPLGESTGAVS
jgi:hypothetical protein